jgi:putative chitinase
MISTMLLKKAYPASPEAKLAPFVAPLNTLCAKYRINTTNRLAAFLAQVGHESGGFIFTAENLNYSAKGLRSVFGKYFPTDALANAYQRKPEAIANRVYASRMGNGDERSGDGWRYRGRSLIQITGKANYTAFAAFVGKTVPDAITYLETPEGAVMGAVWFWESHNLSTYADKGDLLTITKKINGGTNGLQDRVNHYATFKRLLAA